MFKRCNVVKKVSSILLAVIMCSTSAMAGYAATNPEDSSIDEIRGGVLNI